MPELQPMIDGIQATCSQPKDCIVAEIGRGDDTGAVTVPLQRGYTCPATVSKDVWEGTATYDDTYAITQADGCVGHCHAVCETKTYAEKSATV